MRQEDLDRVIGLLAESKMLLMVAAASTHRPADDRAHILARLRLLNRSMREQVEASGGLSALPHRLAVWVRVCELGEARLSE